MKRLLVATGLLIMSSLAANAAAVTYNTTASQLCIGLTGCGVQAQNIGTVNITFNPIASSTVNANPDTFGSFGEINISCVGGGTACGSQSLAGLNLYITIGQTIPSVGNASITGVIVGTISGTASAASISWANPNTVMIGVIRYGVQNNPLALVPASVNDGVTSIQANIRDTTIPEPSTYALISIGLIGFGLLRRRAVR